MHPHSRSTRSSRPEFTLGTTPARGRGQPPRSPEHPCALKWYRQYHNKDMRASARLAGNGSAIAASRLSRRRPMPGSTGGSSPRAGAFADRGRRTHDAVRRAPQRMPAPSDISRRACSRRRLITPSECDPRRAMRAEPPGLSTHRPAPVRPGAVGRARISPVGPDERPRPSQSSPSVPRSRERSSARAVIGPCRPLRSAAVSFS